MASTVPKKYGLIVPMKNKVAISSIKKPSVFGDSSSDEESDGKTMGKAANRSLWRENKKNAMQIESHQSVVKALEDDPNAFEYDSLYDEMKERKRRADPRLAKKDKTSKYIAGLKKVAERRKLEQDIIYERKVQREMEQEGKDYGDKDTFLTSAYRKTLEERKKFEEELKMAARKEEADDVTKQVDMSRFHRTLLHKIAEPDSSQNSKEEGSKVASGEGEQKGEVGSLSTPHESLESVGENERQRSRDVVDRLEDRRPSEVHVSGGSSAPAQGGSAEERQDETTAQTSLFPPKVDRELKRKIASAKRVNEESLGSAKERYLARKKAKLTAPIISDDD